MAERRMFAKSIVTSDAFLDMPMSARLLYFTLGMFADDDGFVNSPKSIIRQIGSSQDDLSVLIAKKFVIAFEDGIIVIKHWRINNLLRADRYQPTKYIERRNELFIDENGAYTQHSTESIENKQFNKTIDFAREKRKEARKASDLPYSFDYKIRTAFHLQPCPICGSIMDMNNFLYKPTIQHNIPISLGGKHEIDNISVICKSCNTSIQNRHITENLNNDKVIQIWNAINKAGLVSNPDTKDSIGKNSIGKDNKEKSVREKKDDDTTTTTLEDFLTEFNIAKDNYSERINEMDYNALSKAYRESIWLQANITSLSRICEKYEWIVGGYYKDYTNPKTKKMENSHGYSKKQLNDLVDNIDDIDF